MEKSLREVVAILKSGGVIVYPTETVYGLGGNAFEERAVNKIIKIKSRRESKPLIILVKDFEMAERLCEISRFERVLKRYWPGALTGIFKAKVPFSEGVISKEGAVALRVSAHPFVEELFKSIDFPLISTSANRSGGKACLNIEQVKRSLAVTYELVDFTIDGGELPSSLPSTLVNSTITPPKILRQGVVNFSLDFTVHR